MPLTYRGNGSEFINGVPARDLTDEDLLTLTNEQRAALETVRGSDGELLYAAPEERPVVGDGLKAALPVVSTPPQASPPPAAPATAVQPSADGAAERTGA